MVPKPLTFELHKLKLDGFAQHLPRIKRDAKFIKNAIEADADAWLGPGKRTLAQLVGIAFTLGRQVDNCLAIVSRAEVGSPSVALL